MQIFDCIKLQLHPMSPSLLYEKATTDKKHKIPTYLVLFCMLILCFCRWTKSLILQLHFGAFWGKQVLNLRHIVFAR